MNEDHILITIDLRTSFPIGYTPIILSNFKHTLLKLTASITPVSLYNTVYTTQIAQNISSVGMK